MATSSAMPRQIARRLLLLIAVSLTAVSGACRSPGHLRDAGSTATPESSAPEPRAEPEASSEHAESAAEAAAPTPGCLEIERIEVWKGARTLEAYCKRGAVITIPVALGRQELGAKISAGDHRTPEGGYRIAAPARPGRFHLFLAIDYPSREDAARGLAEGRLRRFDYERIVRAHERGRPPPGDTALGGELGFHGEGARWEGDSRDLDWTYGCIAMSDREIEFLADRVVPGVPVRIHP